MPTERDKEIRELGTELAEIEREWREVSFWYNEPDPPRTADPAEWRELVTLNLIIQLEGEDTRFAAAWHKAASGAKNIFLDKFVPWATKTLELFGTKSYPANVPEPAPKRPGEKRYGESTVYFITNTADVVEAGLRLIFWGAAYFDPVRYQRSNEHRTIVWCWISTLLNYHDGQCWMVQEPIPWIWQAFQFLVKNSGHQPTHDDRENRREQPQFVMEKMTADKILVQYGEERGVITGVAAFRLQKLVTQGRVHVLELGGDLELGQSVQSLADPSQIGDLSEDGARSFQMPILDVVNTEDLRPVYEEMRQLRHDIEAAGSESERDESEKELAKFQKYINQVTRPEKSQTTKARERIERLFRILKTKVLEKMPKFVEHLELSVTYDSKCDKFSYKPSDPVPWRFQGFE